MKFPKKQAQRLIPEYLLDYTTKLNESHPDPTESWGGGSGGSEYTAGDGIDITNNVISVDNTIAKKSDIPSLDGYATQTWVQEQGYKTSITSSDITSALGYTPGTSNFSGSYNDLTDTPTLATVATSGSYNDLSDKPTIPDTSNLVTTNTEQTITGYKTFDGGIKCSLLGGAYTLQTIPVGWRFNFNDPQNQQQKDFSLPIEKSGTEYTLATTDDIHNPTITFTQGGATKGTITLNQSGDQTIEFDAGGGGGSSAPFEISNMEVDSSNQTITLTIVANS